MWWLPLLLLAQTSSPEAHRVALLIGANQGANGQKPLRYAHQDARSMAAVLIDTGGFKADDVHVLVDPDPARLLSEIDRQLDALANEESIFLFYYSGHADFEALYPNGQRLGLGELKARLDSPRATVRIGIIDACRGGGWTQAKGFQPVVPFDVSPQLRLISEGSALLASSSGLEEAHETDAIEGSYFTHHLVAALRGAGDRSTDGLVTLTEAFDYANRMTVRDTAVVAETPQHPSFDIKLHGRQDLVLGQLDSSPNLLDVDEQEGPLQVIELSSGLVVLEIPAGKRTARLAVPAGSYLVRRMGKDGTYSREIAIQAGTSNRLDEASLELASPQAWAAKSIDAREMARGFEQELRFGGSITPFDPYVTNLGVHFGYGVRFTPALAWRAIEVSLNTALDKSIKRQLQEDFAVMLNDFASPSHSFSSLFEWTPLRVMSNDASLGVEAGLIGGPTFVVVPNAHDQLGAEAGAAIRFVFDAAAIELDFTDKLLADIPPERTPSFMALAMLRL